MTQPTTFTVTLPTTNTDGSAIVTGELIDLDIGFGPASNGGNGAFVYPTIIEDALTALPAPANGVLTVPWADIAPKPPLLPPGISFIAVRVKASDGDFSAWSNEGQFDNTVTPNPPMGFTVA